MKKRELIQAVSIHTDVDNKTAAKLVEGTIDVILATVAKGEVVNISGFAKFAKIKRPARIGRNPATGEQIKIAAGGKLPFRQEDLVPRGHAIEVRVNAEDPEQNFRPCPGLVSSYVPPGGPGVRVDSHLFSGYVIPPHYDSLIAKVLAWRPTREEALSTLLRALREMQVEGIRTTIPLFENVLQHGEFRAGRVDTGYLDKHKDELFKF